MKRDIPLAVFLTAIAIVLYIYIKARENTERYDLNDVIHKITDDMEDSIYNKLVAELEEPEYFE